MEQQHASTTRSGASDGGSLAAVADLGPNEGPCTIPCIPSPRSPGGRRLSAGSGGRPCGRRSRDRQSGIEDTPRTMRHCRSSTAPSIVPTTGSGVRRCPLAARRDRIKDCADPFAAA